MAAGQAGSDKGLLLAAVPQGRDCPVEMPQAWGGDQRLCG